MRKNGFAMTSCLVLAWILSGCGPDRPRVECNNGILEAPEQCDRTQLGDATCASASSMAHGVLGCTANCTLDTSQCHTCGDASIQGPEFCDATNLGGKDCMSETGMPHGTLTCSLDCLSLDATGCHICGDGVIQAAEACDSDNLAGKTCSTESGLQQGELACQVDCLEFDSKDCHTCGDTYIHGPEDCDGANLGGQECQDLGYDSGTLSCRQDCTFEPSECCDFGGTNPCSGQTCSGHGLCLMESCQAFCECDAGFVPGPDLTCVPEGCGLSGQTCTDSSQCCSAFCLKAVGQSTGYCSYRDCISDAGCENLSGDYREMCCVDLGGGDTACAKANLGAVCGDQLGTCGASCAGQLESACAADTTCLRTSDDDPGAVCSLACVTSDDCLPCADPGNPDTDFTCQAVFGGERYCRPHEIQECDASSDCSGDDVCVTSFDDAQAQLVGQCGLYGDQDTGAVCDSDENPGDLPYEDRCAGFYCLDDHCSEVCSDQADCPANMVCALVSFCMDPDCETVDAIGMCKWPNCCQTPCAGNPDCPQGEFCDYYVTTEQEIHKFCVAENCDPSVPACLAPGETCGQHLDPCWGQLCLGAEDNSFCSALCDIDADCPSGMLCGEMSVGQDQTTGVCVPDPSCQSGSDCEGLDECVPFLNEEGDGMLGQCFHTDGELDVGEGCDSGANPSDLPPGEKCRGWFCIQDHCTEVCEQDADCPQNTVCSLVSFCLNDTCTQIGDIGMCLWMEGSHTPCDGSGDCPASEICWFWIGTDNTVQKACITENCDVSLPGCEPVGSSDCSGAGADPCWGDLCLASGAESFCSALCGDDTDCPASWTCDPISVSSTLTTDVCLP